jgi:hypothetical protein
VGTATAAPVTPRAPAGILRASFTGRSNVALVDVTMSSSYATGGDTFDFATVGLIGMQPKFVDAAPNAGYLVFYDITNKKFKLFQQSAATSALTEVPNATNLSTVVIRCLVMW